MVDPLHAVLVALVHGVDADIGGQTVRCGGFANADGDRRGTRAAPLHALFAVRVTGAQVVEGGRRTIARAAHSADLRKRCRHGPTRPWWRAPTRCHANCRSRPLSARP